MRLKENSILLILILGAHLSASCGTEVGNGHSGPPKDDVQANGEKSPGTPSGGMPDAESPSSSTMVVISLDDPMTALLNSCVTPFSTNNVSEGRKQVLQDTSGKNELAVTGSSAKEFVVTTKSASQSVKATVKLASGTTAAVTLDSGSLSGTYTCGTPTTQEHVNVSGVGTDIVVSEVKLSARGISDTMVSWYEDRSNTERPLRRVTITRGSTSIDLKAP